MPKRLPNLYGVDLIFPQDEPSRPQIIDVHGSFTGGFPALRSYGGKERIDRYLKKISDFAGGGILQLYGFWDKIISGYVLPKPLVNLAEEKGGFVDWIPHLVEKVERLADLDHCYGESQLFEPSMNRLGVPYYHADGLSSEGGKVTAKNFRRKYKEQGETVVLDDRIHLIVFRGSYELRPKCIKDEIPEGFKVINNPMYDRILQSKWYISQLMRHTGFEQYFPPQLIIGMGMTGPEQLLDFSEQYNRNRNPSFVRKPSHGRYGTAIIFFGQEEVASLTEHIKKSPESPYEILRQEKEGVVDPHYWKCLFEEGISVLKNNDGQEVRISDLDKEVSSQILASQIPMPIFEYTTNILQPYINAMPVRSKKTGELHQGYVRALICGDELIGAVHRFPEQPNSSEFVDLNRREVKTLYQPVSPEEETLLEQILIPLFAEYEKQVSMIDDYESFRRNFIVEQFLEGH